MPRIADALERESRTVDLEQGDFERLLGRRERKQRNQRIRAGAVGVIVALAAGIFLVRTLTSDPTPANPPEPRPAPAAAGTLAYALDGDIYVADQDGSNAVKIADGLGDHCDGAQAGESYWAEGSMWSPDGRYLAYRASDCSSPDHPLSVVISDAEGNVLAAIPTGTGWDIGWAPDSTRVSVWDSFGETIGVYGVDGVRQTQLTPGWSPTGDHDPEWTPDGTAVMVDNVVVPLDGGTPPEHALPADAYSPDGSQVVLSKLGSTVQSMQYVTIARADGSEPRTVFRGWSLNPTWSPTGDRIAFTTGHGRAFWSAELRVVDVATGTVTSLIEGERGTELGVIGFSPRGDRILFSKNEDGAKGGQSPWSIRMDGSDARLVVAGTSQGEWLSR
jgi:Tol biopolymer transport system component